MSRSRVGRAERAARAERVLRLARAGVPVKEIGLELQLNEAQVRHVLKLHGVRAVDPRRVNHRAVVAVVGGRSIPDAAYEHGLTIPTLNRAVKKHQVRSAGRRPPAIDGRTERALQRVAAGATVPDACKAEGAATAYVYAMRKKRRAAG